MTAIDMLSLVFGPMAPVGFPPGGHRREHHPYARGEEILPHGEHTLFQPGVARRPRRGTGEART
jgi:hypothetical protein